ncbi:MAG: aminoacyltransferase [Streptococcaceae bacterium]|jgi:serine/alanine adding enzyme|nr:aminoacyltransferase [Streptococcaceae bacterium]
MTYTTQIGISQDAHDAFLKTQPLATLLQSSKWAELKTSWAAERLGFFDNGVLVASAMVLKRALPLGFSMLYIPRGIVMDYSNEKLVRFVVNELKKYGKSQHALFVKFDPASRYDEAFIARLARSGARYTGRSADMHETIQPRFNAVISCENFSEELLDKKTRQFLRKARNSHVEVAFGSVELVPEFAELMKKTEARKNVSLRNAAYYTKLLALYGDAAFITRVTLDLKALENDAKEAVDKITENLAKSQNAKRQKALSDELSSAQKTLSALTEAISVHGARVPVAGTLTVDAFGAAETLYAGTDTEFQKYYPSYLAWFETIAHAFQKHSRALNMGGLENSLSETDGLLKFKKHFNPSMEEYVGEFDIPVYPALYPLAKWAYNRRKTAF